MSCCDQTCPAKTPDSDSEESIEEILIQCTCPPNFLEAAKGIQIRKSKKFIEFYLQEHKISELFHFLTSHIVVAAPENPIEFLINLLDEFLIYRKNISENTPPFLFEQKHIESLFRTMDPMEVGYITVEQYRTAMKTLGIYEYNKRPCRNSKNKVDKDVFVTEAYNCMKKMIDEMLISSTKLLSDNMLDNNK